MFPTQVLQPYYGPVEKVMVAVFDFLQESAKQFASTACPHLQQMMELSSTFLSEKSGMAKTWLSATSQLPDHQLILLCMIFCLCGLISVLEIIHFIWYLLTLQPSEGSDGCGEQEHQRTCRVQDSREENVLSPEICSGHGHKQKTK
jgi:hypothetical protein